MVADRDLIKKLTEKQRLFERWFAVCVLAEPEIAFNEYSWMPVSSMVDKQVASFWGNFLSNGGDPDKAALSSGTTKELNEAVNEVHNLQRIDVYADGIVQMSRFIRMAKGASELTSACFSEDIALSSSILSDMATDIDKMVSGDAPIKTSLDIAMDFVATVNSPSTGIQTGLQKVDEAIGRLQRKQVSVIASRTSVGKTALSWQIARSVASQKMQVLYISTEMSTGDLWARAVAGSANIDWRKVIAGTVTQAEKTQLLNTSNMLSNSYGSNLNVDDNSYTPQEIHRAVAKIRPDLVVVDHLDELRRPTDYKLVEWLAEVMFQLKFIAKKYDCHVLAVHQINRGPEDRQNKTPMLSDLRNSGDIEQKADAVFILHRPDLYTDTPEIVVSPTELWIRKNRMGVRDGMVRLNFHLQEQWFRPPVI